MLAKYRFNVRSRICHCEQFFLVGLIFFDHFAHLFSGGFMDSACRAFYLMLIGPLHRHKCSLNYPIGQLGDFLLLLYSRQGLSWKTLPQTLPEVFAWGVFAQGGVCLGGACSGGCLPGGCLSRGVCLPGGVCSGVYTPYEQNERQV